MSSEKNLLIRASAGTGKTFSLATRFLSLMIMNKVAPGTILALTFSRAAAQEIYTKLLERLWKAASDADAAAEEAARLTENNTIPTPDGQVLDCAAFSKVLRTVVESQHLGTIATLDSFILRLVRNFPLELGFQNDVSVLDERAEETALKDASAFLLDNAVNTGDFVKVFHALGRVPWPRAVRDTMDTLLNGTWRRYALAHREFEPTEDSMAALLGVPALSPFAEVPPATAALAKEDLKDEETRKVFCSFIGGLKSFSDRSPFKIEKGGKAGEAFWSAFSSDPDAVSFTFTRRKEEITCTFPSAFACAIHEDINRADVLYLRARLRESAARLQALRLVEKIYDRKTRRAGLLTFSDLPEVRAAFEKNGNAADVMNLEYRFDAAFDHWALDEFQDTSAVQWACLRNLVENAAEDAEKSVVAVGDLKQAIYAWRGGDERPFTEMMNWLTMCGEKDGHIIESAPGVRYGRIRDNDTSYRYQKQICDFVNNVFGAENLQGRVGPRLSPSCRAAITNKWLDSSCWREHRPDINSETGLPKDSDYVRVIGVPKPAEAISLPDLDESGEEVDAMVRRLAPALCADLTRIWKKHEEIRSTDTVGILVRKNKQGRALAAYLRRRGLPAVWEGKSGVLDVPVVHLILGLLGLAEHPQDTAAWEPVRCSPVLRLVFPGKTDAAEVSAAVAALLSREGLAGTLQKLTRPLCTAESGLDRLSVLRLGSLVRAAVTWERRARPDAGISDFVRFLEGQEDRELASSSSVIRILSIHRSKGLTIDYVYVPCFESERASIEDLNRNGILASESPGWVVDALSALSASRNPHLAAARDARAAEVLLENLHLYYVALTRARKALYVILPLPSGDPDRKGAERVSFGSVILSALPTSEIGGPDGVLFEAGTEPAFVCRKRQVAERSVWTPVPGDAEPARIAPSSGNGLAFITDAASLFEENAGAAAAYGTAEHERLAAIEWVAEEEAKDAFDRALVKPKDASGLWREQAYELVRNGEWESGRFDRVVFIGHGADKRAVLSDFKTNRLRNGETADAFATRLRRTYADQMKRYRVAVSVLTGIPESGISIQLLATGTRSVVVC